MGMNIKYLKYLVRHKYFVYKAGRKLKLGRVRCFLHDWSKFRPSEWFAYTEFFYGGEHKPWSEFSAGQKFNFGHFLWRLSKEGVQESFDKAWLLHQHRNKHHWQHWILREDDGDTKYIEMPYKDAVEMVADWLGAGRAITGKWDAKNWYERNQERIMLCPRTKELVERILDTKEARQLVEYGI